MIATNNVSTAILTIASFSLLAGSAVAQVDSPRIGSGISLVVDGGAQVAVVPVIAETAQSDLLTYDFSTNEIRFAAGVLAPDYDEPLFCFDLGSPQSPVSVEVRDPNGHIVIDNFELATSIEYVLASPASLLLDPTVNQQCFFRSDQGVFGLFGQANVGEVVPGDLISRDRFEPDLSLNLEYQGVPSFATPGQTISYDLVVTNTGTADFNDVALQELFPENRGVYAAALNNTAWTCSASGDAVCPGASVDPDYLRFEGMNAGGVDITAGDSLTFSIDRTVDVTSTTGESVRLQAGVVADPLASNAPFDVAEALITIIGQSAGLNVAASDATADSSATTGDTGDDAQITVTVLDSSQNPVPNEPVSLDSAGGLTITSQTSGTSDNNGEVVFTATGSGAGDYTVSFTSGTLTGSGTVTILPGAPAAMVAAALDAEAEADGSDTAMVRIVVQDDFGNRVDSTEVTADTVPDPGELPSLSNSVFTNLDGEADFTPTSTVADVFQIEFAVAGAGTDSASVEFLPGSPDALMFTQQPTSVAAEATMTPAVALQVIDANENWVDDDTTTFVQLRLRQNGVTVDSDLASGTVANGEIQFSNLSFDSSLVGTGYTVRAVGTTSSDIFFVDSDAFEITVPQ